MFHNKQKTKLNFKTSRLTQTAEINVYFGINSVFILRPLWAITFKNKKKQFMKCIQAP